MGDCIEVDDGNLTSLPADEVTCSSHAGVICEGMHVSSFDIDINHHSLFLFPHLTDGIEWFTGNTPEA